MAQKISKSKAPQRGTMVYVGPPGSYVPGIPTRNIPVAEWNGLNEVAREIALDLGYYELDEIEKQEQKQRHIEDGE